MKIKINKYGGLEIDNGYGYIEMNCKYQPTYCRHSCAGFYETKYEYSRRTAYDYDPAEVIIESCGTIHKCKLKDFVDERVKEDK